MRYSLARLQPSAGRGEGRPVEHVGACRQTLSLLLLIIFASKYNISTAAHIRRKMKQMRTICLAATKGGVGKTTLTAALAVAAAADGGKVGLVDADPLQSLAFWHLARETSDRLVLIGDKDDSVKARHDAARRGGFDWCLIDSPPAMVTVIEPCVRLADLIVIPVRPSPLDILAIDPIIELSKLHQRTHLFVLNQTTPDSIYTAQAAKLLRKAGMVHDGEIVNRQSYAIAMIRGLTAPEIERSDGLAQAEIAELWKVVKRRCPQGT